MTDKEYKEQKRRIEKYLKKWFRVMGLGWFMVDMIWTRERDSTPNVAARTTSSWQYRTADIEWFLPVFINQSDDKVEQTVVHELVHVLLSGLFQNSDDNNSVAQINEYTTELVSAAIMWTREAGAKDK